MILTILQILQLPAGCRLLRDDRAHHPVLADQLPGPNLRQPLVAGIWDGLNRLLEPVLRPGAADAAEPPACSTFAPLVVFIGIIIARDILNPQPRPQPRLLRRGTRDRGPAADI